MRILIAAKGWQLAEALEDRYSGLSVHAVVTSYAEAIDALRRMSEQDPINVVIVSATLNAARDREDGYDLDRTIETMRRISPPLRIFVMSRSERLSKTALENGAEPFIETERGQSAANLAAQLDLVLKTEVAKVVVLTSLQGGSGKTHAAFQIASFLGVSANKNRSSAKGGVLLWELDLKAGAMAFDLNHPELIQEQGRRTITKILNRPPIVGDGALDTLQSAVISGDVSRLPFDTLLAPHSAGEVVSLYRTYQNLKDLEYRISAILDLARRYYSAVVVDLGTDVIDDPGPVVALQAASSIGLVVSPTPKGLRTIRDFRPIIKALGASERTRLIVNRVTAESRGLVREMVDEAAREPGALSADVVAEGAKPEDWREIADKLIRLG